MKLNFIHRYFSDTEIGAKLTLDAGMANKSMKDIKKEIQDARAELFNMQTQFGATSKQAFEAAKKVAVLTDNLKDANETAKLFDPGNKFQVLGNSIRGLVGGFTALQGVLALAGVEGEELQKTLLKVQGALALTEGLNVIADVTKDFKRLGSVLVQTLGKSGMIGLAIAGVVALGLALSGVFSKKVTQDVKALEDSLKDYTRAAGEARAKTVEVKVAFEQARAGVISKEQALRVYNETLGDSLGKTNDLGTAEKLLADKAETYIQITALKAQANALFAKSAEITSRALLAQNEITEEIVIAGVNVTNRLRKDIQEDLEAGKKIDTLAEGLLRKAGELSKTSNINTGTPTTTPSRTTKKDKKEEAEEEARIVADIEDEKLKAKLFFAERDFKIDTDLATKKIDLQKTIADSTIAANQAQMKSAADLAAYEQYVSDSRIAAAQAVGSALGALAELIGKQTAAGKALAIAQAVINTWLGVTEIIKTKSVLPEPMATISRIANIVAIVAAGLNAVKNIAKANVPGSSSGGAGSSGSAAPLQPQVPSATSTMLDQRQLNQIGNAASRAFVLEADVTNNQERIRRLNRASRL